MRIYSSPVAVLKVSGCIDCPRRGTAKTKVLKGWRTIAVCQDISHHWTNQISGSEHTVCASIVEYLQFGGFHPQCPLKEELQ